MLGASTSKGDASDMYYDEDREPYEEPVKKTSEDKTEYNPDKEKE